MGLYFFVTCARPSNNSSKYRCQLQSTSASLINKREKSSAFGDYTLFITGVVVSVIVAIVLRRFGANRRAPRLY